MLKEKNICKYKLKKNFTELDKTFVLKIKNLLLGFSFRSTFSSHYMHKFCEILQCKQNNRKK